MTIYTTWYLTIAAILHGQMEGVKHSGPNKMVLYFTGATNILYTFGGHVVTVEIMHAMWKPQKFKAIHLMATLYVLTLTLPSAVAVYWAFGDMLLNHSNAFAPKAVKENRNLNHNLQPPSFDPSSINLSTSSPKMTFRNSPAKTAADSSKIKGRKGLPGTNLRRSSKLFLSKCFLNLPTMILLHRFPPSYHRPYYHNTPVEFAADGSHRTTTASSVPDRTSQPHNHNRPPSVCNNIDKPLYPQSSGDLSNLQPCYFASLCTGSIDFHVSVLCA